MKGNYFRLCFMLIRHRKLLWANKLESLKRPLNIKSQLPRFIYTIFTVYPPVAALVVGNLVPVLLLTGFPFRQRRRRFGFKCHFRAGQIHPNHHEFSIDRNFTITNVINCETLSVFTAFCKYVDKFFK